ncbi:hypothetical protein SteCoe_5636 [Stentor coeruleus]|uniref:Uncharacterized protein n=1 Tax=Stentor coeruleus TaxID=5963 RepID=A0A1R2CRW4_9CILI|nr:hypothetical protein SteCoe_5636 [Stentor coeruleus]
MIMNSVRPATSMSNNKNSVRIRTRSISPAHISTHSRFFLTNQFEKNLLNKTSNINIDIQQLEKNPERLELSTQLKVIKNKYNQTKTEWDIIDSTFNITKEQMSKLEEKERVSGNKRVMMKEYKINLKIKLEKLRKKIYNALTDNETYKHIKKRMKATKVFLKIKLNTLQNTLETRNEVSREQNQKRLDSIKHVGKSRNNLRALSIDLAHEKKQRLFISKNLSKDLTNRKKFSIRREHMRQRHEEIVESVSNEEKIIRNNFLRNGVLLHKVWYTFLDKKLSIEMEKFNVVDSAYIKIKSQTGLSNIKDVVQKILTRENNYTSLMNMINESKRVCFNYKEKNSQIELNLNKIMISGGSNKISDIGKLKDKTVEMIKKVKEGKEKYDKMKRAKDYVNTWGESILRKLMPEEKYENNGLREVFGELRLAVKEKIKQAEEIRMRVVNQHLSLLVQTRGFRSLSFYSDQSKGEEEVPVLVSPTVKTLAKKRTLGSRKT